MRASPCSGRRSSNRKGAGIKEELDRARAASEAADAAVKADEALVLIAQTQLGYSTIESPLDGRTGATRVRPGALIRLTDDSP
jgi:multidrug efflux pump subunit AcrA (membrane-fusion protein)